VSAEARGLAARHAAAVLRDALKLVPGTSVIEMLGGLRGDMHIILDPTRLEAAGIDLDMVISTLHDRTTTLALGSRRSDDGIMSVVIEGVEENEDSLASLAIVGTNGNRVLLGDVAELRRSPGTPDSYHLYADRETEPSDVVFLAIAKLPGTNAVSVVDGVLEAIDQTESRLPDDIRITVIQNE